MPILDNNNIYLENAALTATTANQVTTPDTLTSNVVDIMSFIGNGRPVNVTGFVSGTAEGATIKVTVQEADEGGSFADLAVYSFDAATVAEGILSLRLPPETKKTKSRLTVLPSAGGGKITLAVTQDHPAMYEKGLRINAGKVEG